MTSGKPLHVNIYTDGGAKGNPGPAGAGVVIEDAEDGIRIHEAGLFLGRATNNVAEYKAMLYALRQAAALGATRVRLHSDSELMVRQMLGEYRVRNAGLKPLHEEALDLAEQFETFDIRHVRRENNKLADRLVNLAIRRRRNVEDAAG